jgi:hypothetical protein
MKPSIANLMNLLIGKTAMPSNLVTHSFNEKTFIINDVKNVRGVISVKGAYTPWYTENVIEVMDIQTNNSILTINEAEKINNALTGMTPVIIEKYEKLNDLLDKFIKKKIQYSTGTVIIVSNEDFNKKIYYVVVEDKIKLLENIKQYSNDPRENVYRYLSGIIYGDDVATVDFYNARDTERMYQVKKAYIYLTCNGLYNELDPDDVELTKRYFIENTELTKTNIKTAIDLFFTVYENNSLSYFEHGLQIGYESVDGKGLTIKEAEEVFIKEGFNKSEAVFLRKLFQ